MEDITRAGTFSSSSMWKLMTNNRKGDGIGAAGLTYIKQVKYEQECGRPINKETIATSLSWGKLLEAYVYRQILGLEYSLVSKDRLVHPRYSFWTGMPDLKKEERVVSDIKAPFSIETFCDKVSTFGDLEKYKEEFPEDYYQHVSNSILSGLPVAEAIVYCPYESELNSIKMFASNNDWPGNEIYEYERIFNMPNERLPYLVEGKKYKNLNQFEFVVPEADKALLTERILLANKILNQ